MAFRIHEWRHHATLSMEEGEMGFVSLREDIEEALTAASLVAERLTAGSIATDHAEKVVAALLKRCKYITATMEEVKILHSDLSRETRNRIYTLRSERDDALSKIEELTRSLEDQRRGFEVRLAMAAKKIESMKLKPRGSELRSRKFMKRSKEARVSTKK